MTEGLFVDAGFDAIHSRALHICWWLSNVLFSCGPSCWGKLYTAEMICRWFGLEIVLEINFGHRPFWQIAQMPTILKNFYFCCLSLHSQKIMFLYDSDLMQKGVPMQGVMPQYLLLLFLFDCNFTPFYLLNSCFRWP